MRKNRAEWWHGPHEVIEGDQSGAEFGAAGIFRAYRRDLYVGGQSGMSVGLHDRIIGRPGRAAGLGQKTTAMAEHYSQDADRTHTMLGVVEKFDRSESGQRTEVSNLASQTKRPRHILQ